ncbi:sigma 54-interacting response regulator [Paraflavitalea pollutisoli]|uniref:sigma 54-interacting response regulator n=1 Tax=Paraflavitalea pollutisoli TaxID=3034143 RepID=UPI0023EDF4C8|nr:sigma 54-interacting response regulator [Paraflavitalea sp. H1-2-19X]
MREKILIVEDQFIEADYLRILLKRAGYDVTGIAHSVAEAKELIAQERPDIVLLDIFVKGKQTGIDLARELNNEHIAFVYLSANSNEEVLNAAKATQPYGFLIKPYRERDLLVMLDIARYRHEYSREATLRKLEKVQQQLKNIGNSNDSWPVKLQAIARALQTCIPFDYLTAGFNRIADDPQYSYSCLRIGFDEYQQIGLSELLTIAGLTMQELLPLVNTTSLYDMLNDTFSLRSCTSLYLDIAPDFRFHLSVYSRQQGTYTDEVVNLYKQLQSTLTAVVANSMTKPPASVQLNQPLRPKTDVLTTSNQFEGIVGQSPLILNVFDLITRVASSDTSVLILGESGTGKERIADCIHNGSPRKGKPFIKVNCAALPPTLIESELFGHEKGAFTGATDKRIGKFEKADQGTIFLDEIGEMPLELQVKLLRVLQEKYIERIGAKEPTKVNVRVIAATNRNLEKEVAEGRFRLDLYYRLNVFPIELPPLRQRVEDIPLLTRHFIKLFGEKTGRSIVGVSDRVANSMAAYHWPGNIRELENFIERGVLMARNNMIEDSTLPDAPARKLQPEQEDLRLKTIHENERDHIIHILQKCKGRVWGVGGAAEILNLPPTTLASRMKKLGIRKSDIQ